MVNLLHTFRKRATIFILKRKHRCIQDGGRIVLTRDPDGGERCVGCYLCAAACPVDCIALQATEDEKGRRYPEFFASIFKMYFCGYCEEACPTYAIQLTLILKWQNTIGKTWCMKRRSAYNGEGNIPGIIFIKSRIRCGSKGKGTGAEEEPPVDVYIA
jgi:NADH-quinone oxidoreductase subunit I